MKLSRIVLLVFTLSLVPLTGDAWARQTGNQQQQFTQQQNQNGGSSLRPMQTGNQAAQGNFPQGNQEAVLPQEVSRFWPLDADHQRYLDQVLDYWQQSSGQIKQYTCDFQRWDYDPTFCNYREPDSNRLAAYIIAQGTIRYANPDKGMFETTRFWDFAGAPDQAGQPANYKERVDSQQSREKWICDGRGIYEFDYPNKVLNEMEIPAEMQGNGLANSPLPFLFGVEKEIVKERFWIRVVTPSTVEDEYWLEAYPKRIDDARNYKKVEIILAKKDFLPKMLQIYAPNYDSKTNPISRVFEFKNRKINSQLAMLKNFMNVFIRPQPPIGWRRVNVQALATQKQQPPINVGQNPVQGNQTGPRR